MTTPATTESDATNPPTTRNATESAPATARVRAEGDEKPDALVEPVRLQIRFAKYDVLRWISHHDVMRTVERMVRRAGLRLAETQGFTPRPKITFPAPVGLGVIGCREVLELEVLEPLPATEVLRRLQSAAPFGLDLQSVTELPPGKPTQPLAAEFVVALRAEHANPAAVRAALDDFLAQSSVIFARPRADQDRVQEFDLRPLVLSAVLGHNPLIRDDPELLRLMTHHHVAPRNPALGEGLTSAAGESDAVAVSGDAVCVLVFRLALGNQGVSARPEEFLEVLGLKDALLSGALMFRSRLELAPHRVTPPPCPPGTSMPR